jgi:hypothetical protein
MTEVTEIHALVNAAGVAGGPNIPEAMALVSELKQRLLDRRRHPGGLARARRKMFARAFPRLLPLRFPLFPGFEY